MRCAISKGAEEGIYPEAMGSNPSAVRNGPGVEINGTSPGLQVAAVGRPWESVETVESESEWFLPSQEEVEIGVSYMPPTGGTCSVFGGEPGSGETLVRRTGATPIRGEMLRTSGLSGGGSFAASSALWADVAVYNGDCSRLPSASSSARSFPGISTCDGT